MSIHKICDRSGGGADAVRGRSASSPRPDGRSAQWPIRAFSFLSLTPTRLDAKKNDSQLSARSGFGLVVLVGTATEPRQNYQVSEIVSVSSRFSRFSVCASRDVCARVCAHTRTCRGSLNHRTTEPLTLISIYQKVSGSVEVLERFSPRTDGTACLADGGFLPISIILAGGNAALASSDGRYRPISTPAQARAGKSFGVFASARGREIGAQLLDRPAPGVLELGANRPGRAGGRNGGNPPFVSSPHRHVGRIVLEGSAQTCGIASLQPICRLPVRLARRAVARRSMAGLGTMGGVCSTPGHPPAPPFRGRRSSSMLAHELHRIWIDVAGSRRDRRPSPISGEHAGVSNACQNLGPTIGSGSGGFPITRADRAVMAGAGGAGIPRRIANASVGGRYVNRG